MTGISTPEQACLRAAFYKGYSEKIFKNIIQGASGAFCNSATRLVKGGAYVYGSHPDIDALFKEQASEVDPKKRTATLYKIQQLVQERRFSAIFGNWPSSMAPVHGRLNLVLV